MTDVKEWLYFEWEKREDCTDSHLRSLLTLSGQGSTAGTLIRSRDAMRIPTIESSLLASVLLGVVTPLFGIAAYLAAREYEEDRSVAVFGELLARQTAEVEQEVVGLIEGLHSIGALFRSSEKVTREEFGVFTRDILDRHPEIQAIEWAPRVTAEERASHERAVRLEGPTRYRISARRPDGSSEAAPLAEEHYPVLYLEPRVENLPALGLDLASEAARRDALYRAIDTGEPTLTEPIELIQDPGNPGGALILLAVRDERQTPGTTGRAATRGLVLLAIRHRDVVEVAICRDHGRTPDRMYLRLFDEDSGKPLPILFSNTSDDEALARAPWTSTSRISIGGRHWVARGAPTELFLDEHRSTQPLFLGLTVFLITGLLYGTFLVLWKRSRRGARRRRDRLMSRVLSNVQEGVIVGDQRGRIRFVNDPIRRIMGPTIPDSPAEWSKACGCYMSDGQTPYPAGELPLVRAIRGEIVDPEDIYVLNDHNPDGLWLSVSGTPLLGEAGEPRGGVVLVRDITESREKQAHLQRLSNALDQTADMVVITDRGGKIIYVNPAFSKQTGYSVEDALGHTPRRRENLAAALGGLATELKRWVRRGDALERAAIAVPGRLLVPRVYAFWGGRRQTWRATALRRQQRRDHQQSAEPSPISGVERGWGETHLFSVLRGTHSLVRLPVER